MDEHDDFDSVSWRNDPESDASRPTTSGTDAEEAHNYDHDTNGKRRMSSAHEEPQAGPLADAVDLAGIGDGVLECRVDTPLKENDGTKDAYISYLVTTNVSSPDYPWSFPGEAYGCLLWPRELSVSTAMSKTISLTHILSRPTSSRFRNPNSVCDDDSPTSISCTRPSTANTQHVLYHPFPTSTRWSTYEETDLAQSLPPGDHGRCIGF